MHIIMRRGELEQADLEYGLLVGPDELGSVGDEVTKQLGTLLLVASNAAVFELRQDLNQHFSKGGHDKGRVEVAKATNDAHRQLTDTKYLWKEIISNR